MSPVLNFRRASDRFDPKTIALMTLTHDRVCEVFGLREKALTREVVAGEIIALLPRSGSDADRLYRDVVKVLKTRMLAAGLKPAG